LAHCDARAFVYHARQALVLELPELEQRLSNLQSQVERLWRKAETSVPPIEQRLAAMADQYAEYLKRWAATVERHTTAVSQLEAYASEWKDSSTRVRQETADRLQELESTIEREWDTLKKMQEEPIRELREQAESLSQVSLAMANASQEGVERAEARFAAFETEVHIRLTELTRELTTALAEMKARLDRQTASRDASSQWSLDEVTRLHGQLRDGTRAPGQFPHTIDHDSVTGVLELPAAAVVDSIDRRDTERVPIGGQPKAGTLPGGLPPKWIAAVGLLGLAVVIAAVFGWRLQGQIKAATDRAAIAEKKSDLAVSDGFRQAEEARAEAEKQKADAREMAGRVQRIGNVMTAPDLIRFNLAGPDGASGQALFSRSHGLVINGSGLPALPENASYVGWIVTRFAPVKMGPLTVEPDGTVTLVQPVPTVPRVVGMMVTQELADGADAPSGAPVLRSALTQLQPAPEASPEP
jgi:hypothetical protein